MNFTKKQTMYVTLTTIYCCMLIVSNILAGRTFEVGRLMLPSAVIVFPVVYIINDVMTECFGLKNASKTILTAFGINLVSVICFNIAINLPTSQDFTSYSTVLGGTVKALIASFVAYLIGSYTNALIMAIMRKKANKQLMFRCILSTLFGESLDACVFISIMFAGILPANVVTTMIVSQALTKTIYEIIVYPATKQVIKKVKRYE